MVEVPTNRYKEQINKLMEKMKGVDNISEDLLMELVTLHGRLCA